MSEVKKDAQTLLFVKNPTHQFDPIERFLKKRGYNVVIEIDVKRAMLRIAETNPDYVFLAWDHKNANVRLMPKNIYKSSTSLVVPFLMNPQRDQLHQLEASGFESKLYPPLSGPAIIRAISKFEKKNQIFDQIEKKPSEKKKQSEMIQVKSFFKSDEDGPEASVQKTKAVDAGGRQMIASKSRTRLNMFLPKNQRKSGDSANENFFAVQSGLKAKMMTTIDEELTKQKKLSAIQKENTKANLLMTIEKHFNSDDLQGSFQLAIDKELSQWTETTPTEQQKIKENLMRALDTDSAISESLSKDSKSLSKTQINFLDESFKETIRPEMFDVIEAYADQTSESLDLTQTSQIYILTIQEPEWTGYLTVASESYLDMASAQDILNNWIRQMIQIQKIDQPDQESDTLPERSLIEIHVAKVDFSDLCSLKADFFKEIDFQGKKTMLGFFSFSPFQVINSVHETFDMLELPTEFLQPNKILPFDVNLYLTENKKFILYLRPGAYLDDSQVSRLQSRRVKYIFSHMEYESALLQYKAEFNIKNLIENYSRIKGSKT